jgi:hypothetical protein
MTQISEATTQLLVYLERYTPEFAKEFNPGISEAEIQNLLNSVEYDLPNNFYELYRWRNGHPDYFNQPLESAQICQFSPIKMVAENRKWNWWESSPPKYKHNSILPFIQDDSRFFGVVLGRSYEYSAHIVHVGREGQCTLRYDSIEAMLGSTVECFEKNAFYTDDEGWLEENTVLAAEILREFNPQTLAESMLDVMAGLEVYGLDDESDQDSYSILVNPFLSGLETLRILRSPEAIVVVQTALARLETESSDRAYSAKYTLNRWLSDVDAGSSHL